MSAPRDEKERSRFSRIDAAYMAALAGRDAATVSIFDLMPAIFDAVPDTSAEEIAAALRWAADRAMREAEALKRYRNARRSVGKQAQPGDGTLPFSKRGGA